VVKYIGEKVPPVLLAAGEYKASAPLGALGLSPETGEGLKNSSPVPFRQRLEGGAPFKEALGGKFYS